MLAAIKCGRNSIGIEIDEEYCHMVINRLKEEGRVLERGVEIGFFEEKEDKESLLVKEELAVYRTTKKGSRTKKKGRGKR